MKRYLVFKGRHYYPSGGMDDFLLDCDNIKDCKQAIINSLMEDFEWQKDSWDDLKEYINYEWSYSWCHIYDMQKQKIIWSK